MCEWVCAGVCKQLYLLSVSATVAVAVTAIAIAIARAHTPAVVHVQPVCDSSTHLPNLPCNYQQKRCERLRDALNAAPKCNKEFPNRALNTLTAFPMSPCIPSTKPLLDMQIL